MRKVLFVALLMLASGMLLPSQLLLGQELVGQEQSSQKIIFHVTAVRSGAANDYCTTGKCSATRITVEGYSDVNGDSHLTEYVLECVEEVANDPKPHLTAPCVRVHATRDYAASLSAFSIGFNIESIAPYQFVVSYTIVAEKEVRSEKEVNKQKQKR